MQGEFLTTSFCMSKKHFFFNDRNTRPFYGLYANIFGFNLISFEFHQKRGRKP